MDGPLRPRFRGTFVAEAAHVLRASGSRSPRFKSCVGCSRNPGAQGDSARPSAASPDAPTRILGGPETEPTYQASVTATILGTPGGTIINICWRIEEESNMIQGNIFKYMPWREHTCPKQS
ncbi:hypothetical protein NDU88_002794 [Pleurodeles waltl]|uniref:Uncharacterized protein n=1 Tax=Pleurodeles waltl TaxID=8319 RepID=A0AAV7PF26_PLEWA|nr:hypothetical protein NDU88_002794 [Pleurodeles waltl]